MLKYNILWSLAINTNSIFIVLFETLSVKFKTKIIEHTTETIRNEFIVVNFLKMIVEHP